MAVFGHGVITHSHNFTPFTTNFPNPICKVSNLILPSRSSHSPWRYFKQFSVPSSSSAAANFIPPVDLQDSIDSISLSSDTSWSEFARNVSGEWDGFGADFTREGNPIELPESVVPEAFREWEVKVFDWQTQCPTLAMEEDSILSYRSIKLLPTVGCEADAATVYTSDERTIPGQESRGLAAAYQRSGSYVSVWSLEEKDTCKLLEVEHCLIDPSNRESRVRVIQIIRLEDMGISLQSIKVFSELWYGPFRNGDQLGGCAIRDSGFASTDPLKASEITGVWKSHEAIATINSFHDKIFHKLIEGSVQEIVRDECSLITLPRQLWCSLNKLENGETCVEAGWLLDSGSAISSRCVFSNGGQIKEIVMGRDTATATATVGLLSVGASPTRCLQTSHMKCRILPGTFSFQYADLVGNSADSEPFHTTTSLVSQGTSIPCQPNIFPKSSPSTILNVRSTSSQGGGDHYKPSKYPSLMIQVLSQSRLANPLYRADTSLVVLEPADAIGYQKPSSSFEGEDIKQEEICGENNMLFFFNKKEGQHMTSIS